MSNTKTTTFSVRFDIEKLQTLKNIGVSVSAESQAALEDKLEMHLLTEGGSMDAKGIIAMQARIRKKIDQTIASYEERTNELYRELARLTVLRQQASMGLDVERITLAESLLEMKGEFHRGPAQPHGDSKNMAKLREEMVDEVITELALHDGERLFGYYYGIKNYAHFGDQRCDCRYGLGPDHGSIVFSIGLKPDVIVKRKLTYKQIDALIYFLEQMKNERLRENSVEQTV